MFHALCKHQAVWCIYDVLLVIKDHGVILCLLAVVLSFFRSQLDLEVIRSQPELQDVHRLLLLHVLHTTAEKSPITAQQTRPQHFSLITLKKIIINK